MREFGQRRRKKGNRKEKKPESNSLETRVGENFDSTGFRKPSGKSKPIGKIRAELEKVHVHFPSQKLRFWPAARFRAKIQIEAFFAKNHVFLFAIAIAKWRVRSQSTASDMI